MIEMDSLTNVNNQFYIRSNAQLSSIEASLLFETGDSGGISQSMYIFDNDALTTLSFPQLRKVYDEIEIKYNNLLDVSTQLPCEMYVYYNDSFDCSPSTIDITGNATNTYCFQDLSLRGTTTLTTAPIQNISSIGAESGGQISLGSNSFVNINQRGVVYSTSPNPLFDGSATTDPFYTTNGNFNEDYVSYLYNLSPNTTYYVRAYATDCNSTVYGNELIFITSN